MVSGSYNLVTVARSVPWVQVLEGTRVRNFTRVKFEEMIILYHNDDIEILEGHKRIS